MTSKEFNEDPLHDLLTEDSVLRHHAGIHWIVSKSLDSAKSLDPLVKDEVSFHMVSRGKLRAMRSLLRSAANMARTFYEENQNLREEIAKLQAQLNSSKGST